MKANNRGFTMVELLAVIVILGILMGIGLPILTNVINNNRKKEYISDATKMVARAEYFIKAKSSIVETPNDGNAIVISLKYLDDGSFSNAPYSGKYNFDASYVVMINDGSGKLKSYVVLVEDMPKGGRFGIKLMAFDDIKVDDVSTIKTIYPLNAATEVTVGNYVKSQISGIGEIENYYYET